MLFELQKYKLGSERGNCLDQIAESVTRAILQCVTKVDHRQTKVTEKRL